jgi:predicted ATPase
VYISNVYLKNVRCFGEVNIPLKTDGKLALWTTILGDNGTGKTTVLRSIAMGLCDKADVSGLLQDIYGEWISEGKWMSDVEKECVLRVDFTDGDANGNYFIETTIIKSETGSYEITQKTKPDPFPWDDIFVCGYGAARRAFGTRDFSEYFSVDAFYTLFNYDLTLQSPELVLRRLKDPDAHDGHPIDFEVLLDKLASILQLSKGSVRLSKKGIEIKGPWGNFVSLGATADGYNATLAWIVDMLSWAMLYDVKMFDEDIKGIVLLDELEQHVHPSWQRRIISLLRTQFPKIQFITTTHSPLIAANASKLYKDDLESKLFHLTFDNQQGNQISEVEEKLRDLDCDQVLSSEAFDYIFGVDPDLDTILREASVLAAKDERSKEEEVKLQMFKDKLREVMFPKGKTLIERVVEREYYTDLKQRIEEFNKIMEQ